MSYLITLNNLTLCSNISTFYLWHVSFYIRASKFRGKQFIPLCWNMSQGIINQKTSPEYSEVAVHRFNRKKKIKEHSAKHFRATYFKKHISGETTFFLSSSSKMAPTLHITENTKSFLRWSGSMFLSSSFGIKPCKILMACVIWLHSRTCNDMKAKIRFS